MQSLPRGALFSLAFLSLASAAAAQKTPKPLPIMRGAVQDTLGQPLEGAQVEIMSLERRVMTPSSGAYRFDAITPGRYWVVARRIGYAPVRTALTLNQGDDREIVFQLEPLPYKLPEVKVLAEDKAWTRRYQDFIWRSRSSFHGHFITRDDIEREHAVYLGDVVRRYLPFTNSQSFFNPDFAVDNWTLDASAPFGSSRGSRLMSGCTPAVSVNAGRPQGGWAVNDFRPEDVEAVEVYRTSHQIPFEFQSWNLRCGLVIVWTR